MHLGIEIWCNGSTTDFGSVCPGSNPGISTRKRQLFKAAVLLFIDKVNPGVSGVNMYILTFHKKSTPQFCGARLFTIECKYYYI